MSDVPDEVRRLGAEREERRAARDFAAADELRDRIAGLGYRVVDRPGGSTFEAIARRAADRLRPGSVPSVLELDPRFDASVHWLLEGWPQDVGRGLDAFRRHAAGHTIQHVVADVTGAAGEAFAGRDDVEVVPLVDGTGWGSARNAGLRRSLGRIVVVVDGSIEPTGDVLSPLERALDDPSVGVCGPFGIVTRDLREFEPSEGPDVDAIEGYLMAFRRELLGATGGFDERFGWYRTADVELSFRIKDLGMRAVVVAVPVARHEHRTWAAASEDERARRSKRNFNRFLERFRGRFDLTVAGRPGADGGG
jgi:glycosyltransferase involved in cell wall biosynthesis